MTQLASTFVHSFAALALASGIGVPWGPALAAEKETPFGEARLFFELNDTDGDLGIHALVDGEPWKTLELVDPSEKRMLLVGMQGRLGKQGLTELTFESGEPSFDELDPAVFFKRFPAGIYEFEALTLGGDELESEVRLSHRMPNRPRNVRLNGVAAAESCDVDPLPSVQAPVLIDWNTVTTSHPEIGASGSISVAHYQVVVEDEESGHSLSVELPPNVTQFEVPEDFSDLFDELKFEILVRATNGNQTAIESCFELE
jgi:hypothetical protein